MILDLIINTLGQPKQKPYNGQVNFEFNCPNCADENFGIPDNKYNLGVLINRDKQKFHCWKCEIKGSLKYLLSRYGSYEDIKKYESLHLDSFKLDTPTYINTPKVKLPNEFISFNDMDYTNPKHLTALDYMIFVRKISKKLIKFHKIGFCLTGKYANRIIIPSYDNNNELNYFIARSFDKTVKPTYLAPFIDKQELIFNENNINWNHTIYLVEGVFDMLSLPINTIPLTGKMLSDKLVKNIIKYKPNVIIMLDEDAFKTAKEIRYKIDLLSLNNINVKTIKMKNKDLNHMLTSNISIKDVLFLNE